MKPMNPLDLNAVRANTPNDLKELVRWVCWNYEKDKDGKYTKVPYRASDGKKASIPNPDNWCTFDEACSAFGSREHTGIGFVFAEGDGLVGVDLDGCIDADGATTPEAQEILEELNSYTEISPSGTGVKVFLRGVKPGSRCRTEKIEGMTGIEVYGSGRYFTVTGQRLDGAPVVIENRGPQIKALCHRLFGEEGVRPKAENGRARSDNQEHSRTPLAVNQSDDELLETIRRSKQGPKFAALWAGDTSGHGGDHSGADLALCAILAWWTKKDPARTDRIFRCSGLMRAKWDEKRGTMTYGEITIAKAMEGGTGDDGPTPPVDGAPLPSDGGAALDVTQALRSAQSFLLERYTVDEQRTLVSYGGEFYAWSANHYAVKDRSLLVGELQTWLTGKRVLTRDRLGVETGRKPFPVHAKHVNPILDALRGEVALDSNRLPPFWIRDDATNPVPAEDLLTLASQTLVLSDRRLLTPNPALFNVSALDYAYDPSASSPNAWLKFLEEVYEGDVHRISLLQEWFGYCLTLDTSHHKALLLVGASRSGKSTICRVLEALIGSANTTSVTLRGLAEPFGLQHLIAKRLALVHEARVADKEAEGLAETLLRVTGEDPSYINRKNRDALSMRLYARFVLVSNQVPVFRDRSQTIATRFLVLSHQRSFLGREDRTLNKRFLAERPGILLWALEGLDRLKKRGCFVQPATGEGILLGIRQRANPVKQFLADFCVLDPSLRVPCSELFEAYKDWASQMGEPELNPAVLGQRLTEECPKVDRRRGTNNESFYEGIAVRAREDGA